MWAVPASWTEENATEFYNVRLRPELDFLEKEAKKWKVDLSFDTVLYGEKDSEKPIRFNGTVGKGTHGNKPAQRNADSLLSEAAAHLGYTSDHQFVSLMGRQPGYHDNVYIIALNKDGRSYAVPISAYEEQRPDKQRYAEYCVIFAYPLDGDCQGAMNAGSLTTAAHEILHLYGAEDYYKPDKRKHLAEKECYTDIMLWDMKDRDLSSISEMTAFSIGWIDTPPSLWYNEGWQKENSSSDE